MKQNSNLFKAQPTPLVSLFVVITSLLCAVFVYQHFFNSGVIDFSPVMLWVAVAIPVGVFGSVFLQVRASNRAQVADEQGRARVLALKSELRIDDGRRTTSPNLHRPLPEKDPFENL